MPDFLLPMSAGRVILCAVVVCALAVGALSGSSCGPVAQDRLGTPMRHIYLRAFKEEREIELWVAEDQGSKHTRLAVYKVLAASGGPGPKRKEGDRQVPEGIYHVDRFNPKSRYHLSMGINYPNRSDLKRSDKEQPGSDIFIHGKAVSIGCLAIGDAAIEELYGYCDASFKKHGTAIRVDIFPFRMTDQNLARAGREHPQWKAFWSEISPAFSGFERDRRPVAWRVDASGRYLFD